jgi:hypothetical protein
VIKNLTSALCHQVYFKISVNLFQVHRRLLLLLLLVLFILLLLLLLLLPPPLLLLLLSRAPL